MDGVEIVKENLSRNRGLKVLLFDLANSHKVSMTRT